MPSGPFPLEQVTDPQFEEMVGHICLRPSMYVNPATYGSVCAFIDGFNAGRSGGPLMGLQQWLVVRVNDGNNLHWSGLAQHALSPAPDHTARTEEERSIRALGHLLGEFFEYRRANGLTKVFNDYARWLLRRSWYTGPLRRGKAADA